MKSFSNLFLIAACCLATAGLLQADESQYLLTPPQTNVSPTGPPGQLPTPRSSQRHPIRTLVSSLAIVLGAFLLLSLLLRKKGPNRTELNNDGPHEMMQSLGELSITPQVKLNLVRVGSRLLVLHVGEKSVQTVAEISDPDEVAELIGREASEEPPQVSDLLRRVEDSSYLAEVA